MAMFRWMKFWPIQAEPTREPGDVPMNGNLERNSSAAQMDEKLPLMHSISFDYPESDVSNSDSTEFEDAQDFLDGGENVKQLQELISEGQKWDVDDIRRTVTAKNLCASGPDPIGMAFKVNKKLKQLAETSTENNQYLQDLADKVEDFAVELLDQVRTKEEASIMERDGHDDRYGSLFSEMTKNAIIYGQKKFVSHPFMFKRVNMRWQRGSPLKSVGAIFFILKLSIILLETISTPLLLPLIAYASYRDQKKYQNRLTQQGSRQRKRKQKQMPSAYKDEKRVEVTEVERDQKEEQHEMTLLIKYRGTKEHLEMIPNDREQTEEQSEMPPEDREGAPEEQSEMPPAARDRNEEQPEMTPEDRDRAAEEPEMPPLDRDRREEQPEMTPEYRGNGKEEIIEIGSGATDQKEKRSVIRLEKYFDYINTPFVIFAKTEFMKLVFIGLHCRICILGSSVKPIIEEYVVFLFFLAVMLSEYEQWRTSAPEVRNTVYFKDMWNWLDLLTMAIYFITVILRVIVIIRGGDPFHNRLLEIVSYCYGFNTMFLILRFSSILELSSVFGPLQLALFRMCVDLLIILVQFAFVIAAFSMALAKIYSAEMSYLMSIKNQTANNVAGYEPYCTQGAFKCLYRATRQLIWSVFGLMESTDLESHTSLTSEIVGVLYLIFLILSVIMLVNILVALLTNTYEKYRNAENRKKVYDKYFKDKFFPKTTERYLEKYGGSFPLSVDEKLDNLQKSLKELKEINGRGRQSVQAPEEDEETLQTMLTQLLRD